MAGIGVRVLSLQGRASIERALVRTGCEREAAASLAPTLQPISLRIDSPSPSASIELERSLRQLGFDPVVATPPLPDETGPINLKAAVTGPALLLTTTQSQLALLPARLRGLGGPSGDRLGELAGELELTLRVPPPEPMTIGGGRWDFSRTRIAGIINVTPDSFSDGGRFMSHDAAIAHGVQLAQAGADLLDIGGESTRAGAKPLTPAEEQARILPVIRALATKVAVPLSIDTYHAATARSALAAGCSVVNDVSGMALDPGMPDVVAASGAVVILGHLRGTPQTMMERIHFVDVVDEVGSELAQAIERAVRAGVARNRIIVDPGLGFGKHPEHSLELLARLGELRQRLGRPVMVGPSRKGFVGEITGAPIHDRLHGTLAAATCAMLAGADLLRVHDVAPIQHVARMAGAIVAITRGAPVASAESPGWSRPGGR